MMAAWQIALVALCGGLVALGAYSAAALAHRAWRRWRGRRVPPACGPDHCNSPLGCLAPTCYGRLRYGPEPSPAAALDPASERLWDQFDRPGPPYPDWYRPENDPAAPFGAQHGAGAVRYFARNMHDHRRGPKHCPACQGQS